MTEIELHQPQSELLAQMDYARAVATASMLPDNYRGKPADIMLAVGLGSAMGLSPAESLYRISVIKGKPTASAELVAANVRKAGHRLRVMIEPGKATATIVRADDPEFEFTVTRDSAWAQQMGLANNENYKKQGDTMLSWRAITAAARLACPEALYGVQYTPDEMSDFGPGPSAGGLGAVLNQTSDPAPGVPAPAESPVPTTTVEGEQAGSESPLLNTSSKLARQMFALFGEIGLTEKPDRLAYVSDVVGRTVTTSGEMTDADASRVIDAIRADLEAAPVDAELVPEGGEA